MPTELRVEALRARLESLETERDAHEARFGRHCGCDEDASRDSEIEECRKALAREELRMLGVPFGN